MKKKIIVLNVKIKMLNVILQSLGLDLAIPLSRSCQ